MSRSMESERPILAGNRDPNHRASMRFSTYSKATSDAPSERTFGSNATDPEIRDYKERLKRLEDQKMQDQRYHMSQQKIDEQSKLALANKVQRSLARRYVNQDATMRPKAKKISEKA